MRDNEVIDGGKSGYIVRYVVYAGRIAVAGAAAIDQYRFSSRRDNKCCCSTLRINKVYVEAFLLSR